MKKQTSGGLTTPGVCFALLLDLNGDSVTFAVSRGSHDRAYRLCYPAVLSDNFAHIIGSCGDHKNDRSVFAFIYCDVYAVRIVHQSTRDVHEHLFVCVHCMFRFSDAELHRAPAVGAGRRGNGITWI